MMKVLRILTPAMMVIFLAGMWACSEMAEAKLMPAPRLEQGIIADATTALTTTQLVVGTIEQDDDTAFLVETAGCVDPAQRIQGFRESGHGSVCVVITPVDSGLISEAVQVVDNVYANVVDDIERTATELLSALETNGLTCQGILCGQERITALGIDDDTPGANDASELKKDEGQEWMSDVLDTGRDAEPTSQWTSIQDITVVDAGPTPITQHTTNDFHGEVRLDYVVVTQIDPATVKIMPITEKLTTKTETIRGHETSSQAADDTFLDVERADARIDGVLKIPIVDDITGLETTAVTAYHTAYVFQELIGEEVNGMELHRVTTIGVDQVYQYQV